MLREDSMRTVSPNRRRIRAQEAAILNTARRMLLTDGYYGLTMGRVAEAAEYAKGTVYQRFSCKEDLILVLAYRCIEKRLQMMRRGALYPGRPRERIVAVGEGFALFTRLNTDDSRIIHLAEGILREKARAECVAALESVELETGRLLREVLSDAVVSGDLELRGGLTIERVAYAFWALVDGAYTLIENRLSQKVLGIADPVQELWQIYSALADAFGWRPLMSEVDWEEVLAQIRRTIFPEEAQQLYGEGCWYGDAGEVHPGKRD